MLNPLAVPPSLRRALQKWLKTRAGVAGHVSWAQLTRPPRDHHHVFAYICDSLTDWLSDGRAREGVGEGEGERERCRSIKDNNNEAQSEASARCGTVAPGYDEDDVHKLRLCRQTLSNLANASSQGVDCGQQLKSHSHLINCYAAATSCSCSCRCSCSNANDAPDMPHAYTYLIPDICICKYVCAPLPLCKGAKAFRDALRPCCTATATATPRATPSLSSFPPPFLTVPSHCLVCIVCASSARTWLAFNAQISLIEFLFTLTKFPTLFFSLLPLLCFSFFLASSSVLLGFRIWIRIDWLGFVN